MMAETCYRPLRIGETYLHIFIFSRGVEKMANKEIKKIIVTGSVGQIGSELTLVLREKYGAENVVACGRKSKPSAKLLESGPFEWVDVSDPEKLKDTCKKHNIDTIINMAAILSATGEKNPQLCWKVNMPS